MKRRGWLLVVLALLVVAVIVLGVHKWEPVLVQDLRDSMDRINRARARSPIGTALVYFLVYVANAAFSLPFGGLLTAAAGAIFGFWWGLLIASVSGSVGAVAGLLVSRYLFHAAVERRFGARLAPIHKGLREEGAFYLFALRMVAVFPYWLTNLLMGLTTMRVFTFWWVSTLGLLPLEAAYVFVGKKLMTIDRLGLSWGVVLTLLGVGVFPLLLKRIVGWMEQRFFKHED